MLEPHSPERDYVSQEAGSQANEVDSQVPGHQTGGTQDAPALLGNVATHHEATDDEPVRARTTGSIYFLSTCYVY